FCFFFCRYGVTLVVLSFPTRRSSDLRPNATNTRSKQKAPEMSGAHFFNFSPKVLHSYFPTTPCEFAQRPVPRHAPGKADSCYPVDRKSTRLNSSHVKISYAVFCLKKK